MPSEGQEVPYPIKTAARLFSNDLNVSGEKEERKSDW